MKQVRKFGLGIAAAALFMVSSIVVASGDSKNVQQVASSAVDSCEFIGDVRGFAGWGEPAMGMMGKWKNKAKHQALHEADERGANRVVWTKLPKSYGSPYAYGKAYYCGSASGLAAQQHSSPQETGS
ncbi:hypothetical protein [Nitrosococcus watsonii]|uniref:Uncharacterized protein n=1 Tax=Nitrosococcus watsoni (strain C-113) TaxID=105559 RepID=D8K6R0_NITWC|nr:hypothetical protein [Nitrosococcus watsonii]ADJ28587.1 conserved hypothetical protein [Nitrosococcus watsonii C-113]